MFRISLAIWTLTLFAAIECVQFRIGELRFDTRGLRVIHEGTKWCGSGDIAENDEDLGEYRVLDACCRSHDKCADSIEPGQTKHGLTNRHVFCLSHCKCDYQLYSCLKAVDSSAKENRAAINVGDEYFNDLNVQCFDYTLPAICTRNETRHEKIGVFSLSPHKCTRYEFQEGEKQWQWFDVPFFED